MVPSAEMAQLMASLLQRLPGRLLVSSTGPDDLEGARELVDTGPRRAVHCARG